MGLICLLLVGAVFRPLASQAKMEPVSRRASRSVLMCDLIVSYANVFVYSAL